MSIELEVRENNEKMIRQAEMELSLSPPKLSRPMLFLSREIRKESHDLQLLEGELIG